MKKITIMMDDGADLTQLMAACSQARDFRMETVAEAVVAAKPKITRHVKTGQSVEMAVMEHFTPQGTFTAEDADRWAAAKGYKHGSGGAACAQLVKKGFLDVHSKRGRCMIWIFVKPWPGAIKAVA